MNEQSFNDVDYESIRSIFNSRGCNANQLPRKAVTFIPAERADSVVKLDERIRVVQKWAPFVVVGITAFISFIVGTIF